MNPPNRKTPQAKRAQTQLKQQTGHAQALKPGVVQAKNAVSAQSIKQPVAPPVYSPQPRPNAVQQKPAGPARIKAHPVASPVYKPQPKQVLQTKQPVAHPPVQQTKPAQKAPSASRAHARPPSRSPKTPAAVQRMNNGHFVKTLTGKTILLDMDVGDEKKDGDDKKDGDEKKMTISSASRTGWCSCGSKTPYMQCHGAIPKTGRNDPCRCGSGIKYKRCHGRYYAL
jgi:hypothetical protein